MKHPDCDCPGVEHQHGSRTTYVVHACRCDACREDNRIQARRRTLAKVYGRWDKFVDGDLVRVHLRGLMDQGMGWKRIAQAAGVGASTVYPILYGKYLHEPDHPEHRPPRAQVTRKVAEKLLAVELELAPGAPVDGTGTRRRLQALVAAGMPQAELARRLGMDRGNFSVLIHGSSQVVKATADAVHALYDELWDCPDKSARAIRTAENHGWAPPLAWDDDTIDDPTAHPSFEQRRELQRRPRDQVLEDIDWLTSQDVDDHEICRQLSIAPTTLTKYRLMQEAS